MELSAQVQGWRMDLDADTALPLRSEVRHGFFFFFFPNWEVLPGEKSCMASCSLEEWSDEKCCLGLLQSWKVASAAACLIALFLRFVCSCSLCLGWSLLKAVVAGKVLPGLC